MGRSLLLILLVALLGLPAGGAVAQPSDPVSEGTATDTCRSAPGLPQQGCDTVRSLTHGAAATCRRTGEPGLCTPLNGQPVDDEQVQAYTESATTAAHSLQRRLQEDTPLRHATFVGTHNSYNSYTYRPTPSRMDANQTYSLAAQLHMDVRRLELDVHTWTDVTTGQTAPILCHATSVVVDHVGCTAEMTLADGLAEIDDWLDAHPDEIVMIRVESHLDGEAGYNQAAATVSDVLGDHLFLPPGGCRPFDLDLTRAHIRAAGAQVMLVSDCGQGSAWGTMAWDDGGVRRESTVRGQDFTYPHCAGLSRVDHDTGWIRFYDDATLVSSYGSFGGDAPQRATPAMSREWTRCGVNQPTFDHLTPSDGRLDALVWTWADGEGAPDPAESCAVLRAEDGRFAQVPCTDTAALPLLCRDTGTVTGAAGLSVSTTDCDDTAVPRSGHEAEVAAGLARAAGHDHVAIALRLVDGTWVPAGS